MRAEGNSHLWPWKKLGIVSPFKLGTKQIPQDGNPHGWPRNSREKMDIISPLKLGTKRIPQDGNPHGWPRNSPEKIGDSFPLQIGYKTNGPRWYNPRLAPKQPSEKMGIAAPFIPDTKRDELRLRMAMLTESMTMTQRQW